MTLSKGEILSNPVVTSGSANTGASIFLSEGTATGVSPGDTVSLKAPNTLTASWVMTLPTSGGTSGYVLQTDGSGGTSWQPVTASPAGSTGQLQYNNGGVLTGTSGITTDGSNLLIDSQGDLRMGDGTNYLAFQAPASIGADRTYTLPSTIGSAGDQLLIASSPTPTATAATLVWGTATGTTQSPGGDTDGSVQYNSATVFTGETAFKYNDSTNTLTVENVTGTGTFTAGALAVDNVSIDGNGITVTDTNGNLDLSANGTGKVRVLADRGLHLADADNSAGVTLKAGATTTVSYDLTFPDSVGSANDVMKIDATGNLDFVSNTKTLNFVIGDGSGTLTTGIKGHVVLDADYTLTAHTLVGSLSGALTVTVSRTSAPTYPLLSAPTYSNIITSSLATNEYADKTDSLSISISTGDVLEFNLTANGGSHTYATIALTLVPA